MNQKSKVVYSTYITEEICQSFEHYLHMKNNNGSTSVKTRAAFVHFANICESAHRNPVVTAGTLINQKYQ